MKTELKRVKGALAIYQIFLRAFTPEGTLRAAEKLLPHIAGLGIDIVYLCPFVEADNDERKEFWSSRQVSSGLDNPANPYRIKDYFKVDPEYGSDEDLKRFVLHAHKLGLRVILDLVYFHCGPEAVFLKEHPDFVKLSADGSMCLGDWRFPQLNFESRGLREYLWSNMEFLIREFDIDGYRCDVSGLLPLDFWEEGRKRIDSIKAGLFMLAETYGFAEEQQCAFDVSYGWGFIESVCALLDGKGGAEKFRNFHETQRLKSGGAHLLRSFENHDSVNDRGNARCERVFAREATDAACVLCFSLDGTPFIYNGQEIADSMPHSIYANRYHGKGMTVDWSRALSLDGGKRMKLIRELIRIRHLSPALSQGILKWLKNSCPDSVLSFQRIQDTAEAFAFFNFSPDPCTVWIETDMIPELMEIIQCRSAVLSREDGRLRVDFLPYGTCLCISQ